MSYDVSIKIDTGNGLVEVEEVGNYTSNVALMFAKVLSGPYEEGGKYDGLGNSEPRDGLPGLSGLRCEVAADLLYAAISEMMMRCAELEKLNPPNGWGDFNGAFKFLQNILNACQRHPKAILAVNW